MVHFVGAGCGAADLITVRGAKLLSEADVVSGGEDRLLELARRIIRERRPGCVALVPTVIPILFINVAIKSIGPTSSAVIGALEPVTALVIGATVFGESVTPRTVLGAAMIFAAVIVIVCRPAIERVRHKKGASHSEKG